MRPQVWNIHIKNHAGKRKHRNALERKGQRHIRDIFSKLRESVPALRGAKVASRNEILKKAREYIQFLLRKESSAKQSIKELKRQNNLYKAKLLTLKKIKKEYAPESCEVSKLDSVEIGDYNYSETISSDTEI